MYKIYAVDMCLKIPTDILSLPQYKAHKSMLDEFLND